MIVVVLCYCSIVSKSLCSTPLPACIRVELAYTLAKIASNVGCAALPKTPKGNILACRDLIDSQKFAATLPLVSLNEFLVSNDDSCSRRTREKLEFKIMHTLLHAANVDPSAMAREGFKLTTLYFCNRYLPCSSTCIVFHTV